MENNDIPNDECWMCRRTKEELESLNIELTHFDGSIYMDHTVCRYCEDVIMELCIKIDDETFKERVKETVKEILKTMIDSELLD